MPKGPRGEKRPADVIGAAIIAAKIATGEIEERVETKVSPTAAEIGQKGGKARAKKLTAKQRTAIARRAARKRWG